MSSGSPRRAPRQTQRAAPRIVRRGPPRRNPSSALDLLEVVPSASSQREAQQLLEYHPDIWRGMRGSPIVKALAMFASGTVVPLSDVAGAIHAISTDDHMTADNEYMDLRGVATRNSLNSFLQTLAEAQINARVRRSAVGR